MNGFLTQVLLAVVVVLSAAGLLLWSAASIRYRVTATHLQVFWLGLPVRWVRLRDIKHIGNRPVFWAERWPNTLWDSRRMLVIRRRHGLFKNLVITPKYPFEFKTTLEQARLAALNSANGSGNKSHAPAASQPTTSIAPSVPGTKEKDTV